jgi:hypothetical protein
MVCKDRQWTELSQDGPVGVLENAAMKLWIPQEAEGEEEVFT